MATHPSRPAAGAPPPSEPASVHLTGQHAFMVSEVNARARDVLSEADRGRWPSVKLHQLLNYLHLEVLRQLTDEEWLVFRTYHQDPTDLAPLRAQHLQLRGAIESLTAASPDAQTPAELAAAVRRFIAALESHVAEGQRLLGPDAPSTTALGGVPHTWYALTEGDVVDLDSLPGAQGVDAALARLLRLRSGEAVELRASTDPRPIWRRLAMADPGGYGFRYLQQGPPQWRTQIVRRSDD
jgi:uncharacterized protein (DUF2249 family)